MASLVLNLMASVQLNNILALAEQTTSRAQEMFFPQTRYFVVVIFLLFFLFCFMFFKKNFSCWLSFTTVAVSMVTRTDGTFQTRGTDLYSFCLEIGSWQSYRKLTDYV